MNRFLILCIATLTALPAAVRAQPIPATSHDHDRPKMTAIISDSVKLLMIEHATRIAFQSKTRRELGGKFWSDYRRSVHMPHTWEDTDGWIANYVGHPLQGAASGFIWIEHDPTSRREEFGLNHHYWSTRWRAVAWSAGYSLQFEIGPASEASIGNVGLRPETTGWVDYAVTPAGAFGIMVAEDALDRYFIRWAEGHLPNRVGRAALRMLFNPSRTLSNLAASRQPWHRDTRTISWKSN